MSLPVKRERTGFLFAGTALLITFVIPAAQYSFRRFDDNKLASWHWMFMVADPVAFSLALLACLLLAMPVFRISLPARLRPFLIFILCFIAAAFMWPVPEINVDASRYFAEAKHLELHGVRSFFREWGRGFPVWLDLPTAPFFDGLIFRLFGEARLFVQILNAFLFSLTGMLTFLIGKELWDEDTGFTAGLLLLGMPFLITQTPLMLVDVPMMFFVSLSACLFLRALRAGGPWIPASVLAVILAFFCKYSALLLLTVLPVISAVSYAAAAAPFRRLIVRRSLLVFLPALLLIPAAGALKFGVIAGQIDLFRNFQVSDMARWGDSFASTFLFHINPIVTVAAAASLFIAARKRDKNYLIAAWLPVLLALLQIRRIRYLLPVFPMVALMASYGLAALRSSMHKKIIVACVVLTSLAACFFVYRPFLNSLSAVNLKHAGEFLNTLDGVDAVEVFTLPQKHYPINPAIAVPLLDLFTRKKVVYRYVPGSTTPDKDIRQSRFRFSWEYQNPDYYEACVDGTNGEKAVALIFRLPGDTVPPEAADAVRGLRRTASFLVFNPLFRYRTLVRIYW
jgi:4-amino-4-deoxy-L-arabinose transferase-like glycosyltransferase